MYILCKKLRPLTCVTQKVFNTLGVKNSWESLSCHDFSVFRAGIFVAQSETDTLILMKQIL